MIKADKWLVLDDGTCMNTDTGAILWETKNQKGQPCFKLMDDKGKTHFFLKSTLKDMIKDEKTVEKAVAHMNDYFEWSDFLPIERLSDKPNIVEDFEETLEVEAIRAQKELEYAIEKGKAKEVKLNRKEERDNVKSIMDFISDDDE